MPHPTPIAALLATLLLLVPGLAGAQGAATRGELLYRTHCIECHTTQMHWRERKVASDWGKLVEQVALWQQRQQLNWTGDDILEVARHLNDTIYRLPRPTRQGDARPGNGQPRG